MHQNACDLRLDDRLTDTDKRPCTSDDIAMTTTLTMSTMTTMKLLETVNTYVVSYRHGGAGNARGLWRQDHMGEDPVLIHDLLYHVTDWHLHWHRHRGAIVRHHPHSGGPWWMKITLLHSNTTDSMRLVAV